MYGVVHSSRPPFDVVVLAASVGGVRAHTALLSRLPRDFPAAVVVVQHRAPASERFLAGMLQRRSQLPVSNAAAGRRLERGEIYVAPARGQLRVTGGERFVVDAVERDRRCTADALLASAAVTYGPRLIACILSGRMTDGSAGSKTVKRAGGRVLVQDPDEAEAPGMPTAALATGCADFALPLTGMSHAIIALVMAQGAADLFRVPVPAWAGA